MDKSRSTRTGWWTWVQFGVLCLSIVANVFLWVDRRAQDAAQRKAQYTTEAWKALADFEAAMGSLNRETEPAVTRSYLTATDANLGHLRKEWLAKAVRITTELATKIGAYETASGSALPAREYATVAVKRQMPPAGPVALLFGVGGCSDLYATISEQPNLLLACATYEPSLQAELARAWDQSFKER